MRPAKLLASALLLAGLALAQNPETAVFPGAVATDENLPVLKDFQLLPDTTLNGGITDSATSIVLTDASGWPEYSVLKIDTEFIKVCTKTGNTFTVCSGGRGWSQSTAAAHSNGATVGVYIPAGIINRQSAEIKAIETALGANLTSVGTATPTASSVVRSEADGDLNAGWIGQDQNYSWTGLHDFKDLNDIRFCNQFASLQACHDDLPAGGGTMFVPEGTYTLTAQLALTKTVRVIGSGPGTTIIARSTFGTDAATVAMSGVDSYITGLMIDGNSVTTSFAQLLVSGAGSVVEGVHIRENTWIALSVNASTVRVVNNKFIGLASATIGHVGIWFDNTAISGFSAEGNVIESQRLGAIFGSGSNINISGNLLKSNHCATATGGGQIALKEVTNWTVSNNTILDSCGIETSGIELNAAGAGAPSIKGVIANNAIRGQKWQGIAFNAGDAADIVITGNVISNSGTASVNQPAIGITANTSKFIVSNNRAFDDQGTKTQTYGLSIAAGTSDNYIISGNDFQGNKTGAINDGGTGLVKEITANLPRSANRESHLRYSLVASSSAIANTASTTTFDKSYTIPANALNVVGTMIRVTATGTHSTTGTPTLTFTGRIGGTNFLVSSLVTSSGASGVGWSVQYDAVIRAVGASGTVQKGTSLAALHFGNNSRIGGQVGTASIDTTATQVVDVRALWSVADAANTVTMESLTVEILYPYETGS